MDVYLFLCILFTTWIFPNKEVLGRRVSRRISPCHDGSCYPVTGNLLIGREKNLVSDSTCGLTREENYCIVSHLKNNLGDKRRNCFTCDSRHPYSERHQNSHRVENIVTAYLKKEQNTWWQATPGVNDVYIQLDLEAEFHFTHLVLTFKTFRPASMLVERSYDFGRTWKVYRYFALDCARSFPDIPTRLSNSLDVPICESQYSQAIPSSGGEVVLRVLPAVSNISNPYSEEVQNLLKITNLRINFTKLHTLGDNLFQESAKQNYYYAVYNMVVRGSCSCYGHASKCKPLPGQHTNTNMVHGQCECKHHTTGYNCEKCEDFSKDLPWRPAIGKDKNECKRCNCNSHSNKCHFDPAVYEANNRMSGGVCDDCQHNTMGQQCQECKPHFYLNPSTAIDDPAACIPCDCDPSGSEHDGECEGRTDRSLASVSGRCLCKRFVTGRRCDTCAPGYWNLRRENADGCEACSCNSVGIVPGYECEGLSGECRCKRFVTGRACDQCTPGYWGLGTDAQGCQPCNCDVGGSYDFQCDQWSGHCRCRPNIIGRHCNQLVADHFYPLPDWLVYEAEFARGYGHTEIINRDRSGDEIVTWTGPGFMKVHESSNLEFVIDNIPYSMEYDLIIRYESLMPQTWHDVKITIERSGSVDERGACANVIPEDYYKTVDLHPQARYVMVRPAACLERGVRYIVKLEFPNYKYRLSQQDIHLLIDSLVLLPSTTGNPLVQPNDQNHIHDIYVKNRCRDSFFSVQNSPITDICMRLIFSSSVAMHDGSKACECDPYGSLSSTCDPSGGQCQCREGIYGRKCNQCGPGYYGFSPNGCRSCNCHGHGSSSRLCDQETGQCICLPNSFGLTCGSCQRGFWGFPNCRRCECSGRAEQCDEGTGACLGCVDNSGGAYCERCADGYFGDLMAGCRMCPCPGTHGVQHADTCRLDPRSNRVICECQRGYTGDNCDRCADNYHGNPMVPGGRCEPCSCNNNVDLGVPGSCDVNTGECLRCIYNTEGRYCDRCIRGYYGDALRQNCKPCVCNTLGTYLEGFNSCDQTTGQCKCLPRVMDKECDQCEPGYWNLSSGRGCEPCNCDSYGSLNSQCNQFDGQCQCRPDFGGRDCNGCSDFHWGDRRTQCQPCRCDLHGSVSQHCDSRTGACHCKPGLMGYYCDRCDRSTTGSLPNCIPCGPCFDGWEKIIKEISVDLQILVEHGRNIKHSGTTDAYEREFIDMEHMLEEVRHILASATSGHVGPSSDVSRLIRILTEIRANLTMHNSLLSSINGDLTSTSDLVKKISDRIQSIHIRIRSLETIVYELKRNATSIQERDVTGAFDSIRESYNRSNMAQSKLHQTNGVLHRSKMTRDNADRLLDLKKSDVDTSVHHNRIIINEINTEIIETTTEIIGWNNLVCDSKGNTCDRICGGAGCGHCGGGLTCQDGSVSKSYAAYNYSIRALALIKEKGEEAQRILSQVEFQQQQCLSTKLIVERVHTSVSSLRTNFGDSLSRIRKLIFEISNFLGGIVNRPEDVQKVVQMVLNMNINFSSEDIRILTDKIFRTVQNLTNIDFIIRVTSDTLDEVRRLKQQADYAKSSAEHVRSTAQNIKRLLNDSSNSQTEAERYINKLKNSIETAENNLRKIDENITETGLKSNFSQTTVFNVQGRVSQLRNSFLRNDVMAQEAYKEAEVAQSLAQTTLEEVEEIDKQFNDALILIKTKDTEVRIHRDRAASLKNRAFLLAERITDWNSFVQEWNKKFSMRDNLFRSITLQINTYSDEMELLMKDIKFWERYLKTCGTA